MDRREFLALMGTSVCLSVASGVVAQTAPEKPKADVTLRISSVEIDIGDGRSVKTTGYNGSAPGPVLRLREGKPVTIDVYNETSTPELVEFTGASWLDTIRFESPRRVLPRETRLSWVVL